jgi:hypothetical protein
MDTCELLCGDIQTPVHTTMEEQYLRVFKFYLYIEIIVVAQLVEAARVQFPMVSLEFVIDIILLPTLWPWGLLSL